MKTTTTWWAVTSNGKIREVYNNKQNADSARRLWHSVFPRVRYRVVPVRIVAENAKPRRAKGEGIAALDATGGGHE